MTQAVNIPNTIKDREVEHTRGQGVCITKLDLDRLSRYISINDSRESRDSNHLVFLGDKIRKAKIVDLNRIAPEVITMNSQVGLKDIDTDSEMYVTLVFPDDSNIEQGKLSVLSPIGTAILGHSQGNVIEWQGPSAVRRIQIMKVAHRPEVVGREASGQLPDRK